MLAAFYEMCIRDRGQTDGYNHRADNYRRQKSLHHVGPKKLNQSSRQDVDQSGDD